MQSMKNASKEINTQGALTKCRRRGKAGACSVLHESFVVSNVKHNLI